MFGIRFHFGGAYPFVAQPIDELRDAIRDLDVVDPRLARLRQRLGDSCSHEERVHVADRSLTRICRKLPILIHVNVADSRLERSVES